MAESLRIRALQCIADTSRKFRLTRPKPTAGIAQAAPAIPNTSTILKSLPEHKSLLPLLLSHHVPSKLAKACANKYDDYAKQLKSAAEAKFSPYLLNRQSHIASVYLFFLESYTQALRCWAQSVLNAALRSLKRDPVKLFDWDVTYPKLLWFPLPPDQYPAFTSTKTKESSRPLSPSPAPSHAFPTTYPPPVRPSPGLPAVDLSRAPTKSPCSPSTSTVDIDLLCLRFSKSLVINENPAEPPPQQKVSIFSFPAATKEVNTTTCARTRLSRGTSPRSQRSQGPATRNLTWISSPLRASKSRQNSVPPCFPSSPLKVKATSREASAPTRVSAFGRAATPLEPLDSTSRVASPPSPSPLNTSSPSNSYLDSHPTPYTAPPYLQSPLDSSLDRTTRTPQKLLLSVAGPTTPPAISPGLLSEPVVVPTTHGCPPEFSLPLLTDPFLQFQLPGGYFDSPFDSHLGYNGLAPGLAEGSLYSKDASEMPLGFDYFTNNIPAPTTSNPFENNFLNTYAVF